MYVPNAIRLTGELIAEGRYEEFGRKLVGLIYQERRAYGLRRVVSAPFERPRAKIPIRIRPFEAADEPALLSAPETTTNRRETVELATRRAFLETGIPTCYVAVDARNGSPCYFQWLIGPAHSEALQALFGEGWFPRLAAHEALLENAYTPPAYRGNHIMSEAMALISDRAPDIGCTEVVTFVETANVASLKGCARAGFAPYTVRKEVRSLFGMLTRRSFEPLPA